MAFWHVRCLRVHGDEYRPPRQPPLPDATGIYKAASNRAVRHCFKLSDVPYLSSIAMTEQAFQTVVNLYRDGISGAAVNWVRLVDDIFAHDKVICWW
jgi:hypothetical protein